MSDETRFNATSDQVTEWKNSIATPSGMTILVSEWHLSCVLSTGEFHLGHLLSHYVLQPLRFHSDYSVSQGPPEANQQSQTRLRIDGGASGWCASKDYCYSRRLLISSEADQQNGVRMAKVSSSQSG